MLNKQPSKNAQSNEQNRCVHYLTSVLPVRAQGIQRGWIDRLGPVRHHHVLGTVLPSSGEMGSREVPCEPLEAHASSSPAWKEGLPREPDRRGQEWGGGQARRSEACGPSVRKGEARCVFERWLCLWRARGGGLR